MPRPLLRLLTSVALCASALSAHAQWPEAPIRIVIPYAAGGSADVALRQMAPFLQKRLGQPIVIDNKAGAGGNIGTMDVVHAKPDGYTLLLGATNNFAINQFIYAKLAFDPTTALLPITKVLEAPSLIYISGSLPAQNFKEFAAYAKSHRGQLNYGSPGIGTAPHLSAFALAEAMDAGMTHVAYKGSPPAVMGLISNDTQMFLGGYSTMGAQLTNGRVRALAVISPARLPAFPHIPTGAEAGVPDVVLSNWWGLAAPKGTPTAVVDRLAHDFQSVLREEAVKTFFDSQGFVAVGNSPQAFRNDLPAEASRWKDIVQRSGVKAE